MHPEAAEIGDGCSAFFPADGWPDRGCHGLAKGGRHNSCRKREYQREIPPLRIHCVPPVFVAFLRKPLAKDYTSYECIWKAAVSAMAMSAPRLKPDICPLRTASRVDMMLAQLGNCFD